MARQQNGAIEIGYYYAKDSDLSNPDEYRSQIGNAKLFTRNGLDLGVERRPVVYSDQLLPFDITITAANEYGQMAVQRIYGVEILNSGAGVSVDDIVNEQQCTFICRAISRWMPIGSVDGQTAQLWDRANSTLKSWSNSKLSSSQEEALSPPIISDEAMNAFLV